MHILQIENVINLQMLQNKAILEYQSTIQGDWFLINIIAPYLREWKKQILSW